ncbi:hypothetical protein [Pelagibacterium halotolerans]|uniref:Uncharacterized protein n=1 Tax=Pelagibacterium halotolerans (strain DSM 22347 / JCM 15775 / CGMCC 1.7692 / B2) TaxID=1082931 RepID=G4RFC6_PELHB|nr:hypothetical protein [Pelagibacterium halotolerans]AEQ51964.1 hypothetical protein KKY_1954 [Pelagibacterium halotolerans B2]QJR18245.1 hypothetical protein HKM20_07245 [Pelagibacterium halotolerans]SDZ80555.1 hypothetical protein SAMN05428936_10127 [Pelagibacterium halotolerans]
MTDPQSGPARGAPVRNLAMGVLGILAILALLYVGFLVFFAASEPERATNPAEIGDPAVTSEGVAVPDGGELTNEPTQAAPDSPSRTLDDAGVADP